MNSTPSSQNAAPPPYQDSTQEKTDVPKITAHLQPVQSAGSIKHTDVPQWRWSTNQCREWLSSVYTGVFNLPREEAMLLANKFEGSGPVMYITSREEWMEILGYQRGRSLYALLVTVNNEPDSMPGGITIDSEVKRGGQ